MPQQRFYELARIAGVPVFLHVSTLVLFALLMLAALAGGTALFIAALAYFGVLLAHELGHASVARRLGCRVLYIEIFPFHGRCTYEGRRRRRDESLIAWGGVGAQALVLLPASALAFVPSSLIPQRFALSLVVLTFLNAMMILINLAPVPGLDGEKAWHVFKNR